MTDKEQIMINGVDVSECEHLTYQLEEDGQYYWFCNIAPAGGPDECEYKPKCSYKKALRKLARKTQECEKLKSQMDEDYNYYTTELKTLRDIISNKEKRNTALFLTSGLYRKDLKAIEEIVSENYYEDNCVRLTNKMDDIRNIIKKYEEEF